MPCPAEWEMQALRKDISDAWSAARDSIEWLREHYADLRFYTERDLVWTVQRWLTDRVDLSGLRVFNDYGTEPGERRALSADIAICPIPDPSGTREVLVAVEFKYEPAATRADLDPRKLPVTGWGAVLGDVHRVQRWTNTGLAGAGMAILVDEQPRYAARFQADHPWPLAPVETAKWERWGSYGRDDLDVHVHRFEVPPV